MVTAMSNNHDYMDDVKRLLGCDPSEYIDIEDINLDDLEGLPDALTFRRDAWVKFACKIRFRLQSLLSKNQALTSELVQLKKRDRADAAEIVQLKTGYQNMQDELDIALREISSLKRQLANMHDLYKASGEPG